MAAELNQRLIDTVVFDVGETLVDETRAWTLAAERAGVTTLTLFAVLGAMIDRGWDHREVWRLLGVTQPKHATRLELEDFYPDAIPCLHAVRRAGYRLGLAGNQPADAETHLRRLGLPVEFIASSEGWGAEKPSRRFFTRIQEAAQMPASRIAYVGDRLDNDVLPAKQSGMFAVFISRGPWGSLHRHRPEAAQADARLETLDGLPEVLPAKPPFLARPPAWTGR